VPKQIKASVRRKVLWGTTIGRILFRYRDYGIWLSEERM